MFLFNSRICVCERPDQVNCPRQTLSLQMLFLTFSSFFKQKCILCICGSSWVFVSTYVYILSGIVVVVDFSFIILLPDDIAILASTPNQAETLLHSLERAAASIGLHVNAHKTEYMCFNQTGDISTRDGNPLKLVDKFTYLGSSVSSTEKDIDTRPTTHGLPGRNCVSFYWSGLISIWSRAYR